MVTGVSKYASSANLQDIYTILESSSVFIRSLDGVVSYWSGGSQKLYGWAPEEVVGRNVNEFLRPYYPEPLETINTLLGVSGCWSGNVQHHTRDQRVLNVSTHWILRSGDDSSSQRVLELHINAGGLQSRLAALVDSCSDAVIGESLDGIIYSWNAAAQRLFGYTASEIIGKPILVLCPPKLVDEEAALVARIRRGERVSHYETTRVNKSGVEFDISLSLSPIFDYSGSLVGISKIARDITAERLQKRELLLALERERLAAEAGEVGLWSFNRKTGKMDWNERHKSLFGLDPKSETPSVNQAMLLVDKDDAPYLLSTFRDILAGASQLSIDYRILRPDGSIRWITSVGKLHEDLLLGASIDFTERRLNEDALRRANAGLEEFAYAAAHDLQEPLRNISLVLQELLSDTAIASRELPLELMNIALRNAERMQALIKDLLAFARAIDTPGAPIELLDPESVLVAVKENLSQAILESGAQILFDAPLPAVPMRRPHLTQLLQNLIGNSLKYRSAAPPVIYVSAVQEKTQIILSVSDNGIGIPPEYRQRIFGVFQRLDTNQPGNGVGLALCKRIVEHYGGRIWVETPAEPSRSGSTFYFSIPRSRKLGIK
jgi:PAS domain S-box-containing protein